MTHNNKQFLTCLTCTFHRPKLLANTLAMFLAQDFPKDQCELLILDDGNDYSDQQGDGWRLVSAEFRYPSLPAKYNAAARMADPRTTAFVIMEDDDLAMPFHLSAHAKTLQTHDWSKPLRVLSNYTGRPEEEEAAGRFFASIAVNRDLWEHCGGVAITDRADFDQQTMSIFHDIGGQPGNTLENSPGGIPGYCFRWGGTNAYHGQGYMKGPQDSGWYSRIPRQPGDRSLKLYPQMDDETKMIYAMMKDRQLAMA